MGGCLSKDDRYVGGKKGSITLEQPYVIIPPSPLASAGYDKDDGVSFVEKAANNIVKITKNRQRIDVDKSTNTQPITFNELLCESLLGDMIVLFYKYKVPSHLSFSLSSCRCNKRLQNE